jgi:protein gp37
MGKNTNIEWCDDTVNGQMGCDGCELYSPARPDDATCYAYHLVTKYAAASQRKEKNPGKGWPESFDKPALFPERIEAACRWPDLTGTARADKPWLDGMPRVIFLDDLGDTFTESLSIDWLLPYAEQMAASPHIWLFLTKRPRRMREFFKLLGRVPDNFWPGTTVTAPNTEWRVRELVKIDSPRRWVSLEPWWNYVDFRPYLRELAWIIVGGESEQGERQPMPMPAGNVRELRDLCQFSGVRMFLKQWGAYVPVVRGLSHTLEAAVTEAPGLEDEWLYEAEPGRVTTLCRRPSEMFITPSETMARVGKKKAGAVLDGRYWRQVPAPVPAALGAAAA